MTDPADNAFELPDLAAFQRQMEDITRTAQGFSDILSRGLKSALVDGKALNAVFRQMALSVSSRLVNQALRPLEAAAGSALDGLFSGIAGAGGSALQSALTSTPLAFAKGGVVGSPTLFSHSAGLGLMGEAGAEAVLPLARDANGRLGVQAGSGAPATPPVQITVHARDVESFRRSEAQVSAIVARAVGRGRRGL
ncbi:MAG: phage tail tape measure protein [Roseibium sp.]|nr:phage tail tape measure protein [Roseibium sp.]